jgi:hypothetical protein
MRNLCQVGRYLDRDSNRNLPVGAASSVSRTTCETSETVVTVPRCETGLISWYVAPKLGLCPTALLTVDCHCLAVA